jgi:hypothetical protein
MLGSVLKRNLDSAVISNHTPTITSITAWQESDGNDDGNDDSTLGGRQAEQHGGWQAGQDGDSDDDERIVSSGRAANGDNEAKSADPMMLLSLPRI